MSIGPAATPATGFPPSVLRTVVPFITAYLVTLGGPVPKLLDALGAERVTAGIVVVVGAVWYTLVRLLEHHAWGPFGWLIGYAKVPVYVPPAEG